MANSQGKEPRGETDDPDSSHECSICSYWLNEAVVTQCGHRFCKSCLSDWLQKRNVCPSCQYVLDPSKDFYPDNYTRREIAQKKLKCPNSVYGCSVIGSPAELDKHMSECSYQQKNEEKCPFAADLKCKFVVRPGTLTMEEHLKLDVSKHMELMLKAFQQKEFAAWNPQKPHDAVPPPPQYSNGQDDQRLQELSKRVVILEQRTCEQDARIENLTKQLSFLRSHVDPRYSNGIIIWEINDFQSFIQQLRSKPNKLEYSHESYTSPYGYKFCARINIQPKRDNILSLHVHLMQSENDSHLDWPFMGRIRLCMVHPVDGNLSQIDTIMTKPEILAFNKPRETISTRGFGFLEYANITDIIDRGFCQNDRLVIKIQINIV